MKKTLCLIFCLLMLVPFVASCGKTGSASSGTEAGSTPATEGSSETGLQGEDDDVFDYVKGIAAGVDFKGATFNYIGKEYETGSNFPKKEEETGDIESDAVYFRQRDIEEFFGINIDYVPTETGEVTADRVVNEVTAGGTSYDLVHGSTQTTGQTLLNAAVIRQVDNLKYVDLDQRWWISSLRDSYSILGRLFFLTGPIVVDNYNDSGCMIFNKRVTAMFNISDEELYETVKDGKWTLDRMIEAASAIPENTSGTGVWRYCQPFGYDFILSSGIKLTVFDEDGAPSVDKSLSTDISNLADKLCPIFSNKSETIFTDYRKGEDAQKTYGVKEGLEELFVDDKALFMWVYTAGAMNLRKYDVTFGILPMPKASENQKDYCTYARMGMDSAVYIPRTVQNIDMSDAITESLGALSQKYVKEAYYTKLLKGQSVFDMESLDMIDIIFSTKVYDLIALYSGANYNSMGDFLRALDDAIRLDNSSIASSYSSNAKVLNFNAKQLVKAVNKIDG